MARGDGSRREFEDAVSAYLSHQPRPVRTGQSADSADSPESPASDTLATAYEAYTRAKSTPVSPTESDPTRREAGKHELTEAFDRLVEHEKARPKFIEIVRPEQWRRFVRPAIIVVGLAAIAFIWVFRPASLFPRFDPNNVVVATSPEHQLIAIAAVVGAFQKTHGGRIPVDARELGFDLPTVSFVRTVTGGYQLVTQARGRSMVFEQQPDSVPSIFEVKR